MIEYVILGFLVLVILLLVLLIFKGKRNDNNSNDLIDKQKDIQTQLKLYLKDEYSDLKLDLLKLVNESNEKNKNNLLEFREIMVKKIDDQLKNINDKVDNRLGEGFKKTQETFVNVVERLTKIDEAQKNIEKLSGEVFSLNNILTDKKTRGTFGEIQLHHLLNAVLGDNDELYQEQKQLSNGNIADVIIYAPKPLGSIIVDSKFPLNSYQNMYDKNLSSSDQILAIKQFKNDIKKHIDDISKKYIIINETSDQAIMFIPAEAIFAEIISNHSDLIDYSNKKKVWLVSPTTLISTLTIIQTIVKNMERDKQARLIVEELKLLAIEFNRYAERWSKLERTADTLTKDIKDVNVTTNKISNKFKLIEEGKLNQLENLKLEDNE
ncbi:DNA recombination protein RmuC [Haploplasma axanthum]|uniref:DNA recombination protein rmuC n=1 Tax=Haploplasma axanthum TaxID=29552 RepID=A0A449BBY8_HAPAX|nr:DNA recombination protein RmuC [Haploplasma axanthum]VEU79948.1 DNA recombination protein rmuC [Haploplasma axanthum]